MELIHAASKNNFNLFTLVFLRPGFLSYTVLVKMQVRN